MSHRFARRLRLVLLLTTVLFLAAPWGGGTFAAEPPPAPTAPKAAPSHEEEEELNDNPFEEPFEELGEQIVTLGKSMESTHDQLEQQILDQVIRLDDFFGNVKTEEQRKTRYLLRWRNSLRGEENGNLKPGMTLRANVVLSKISDRLRLAVTGEDEPDRISPALPEDPGNPGFDRTTRNARLINTELRYGLVKTLDMDLFLGAGFRLIIPPEGFVRSRFQYTHSLLDEVLFRFGETLFIKNTSGFGETTEIDLERLFDRKTLVRLATSGTVSEEFPGMEWGAELSASRELSPKSAITVACGVYGNTSASTMVGSYKVYTRYRRNFLRSWLFYELEPEVSWPRNVAGQYLTTFAVTGRIEVVFEAAAKDRHAGSWP